MKWRSPWESALNARRSAEAEPRARCGARLADHKGSFAGSVLLSKAEWDKEQLIRDLREEWGIVAEEPDEGDEDVENLSLIHISVILYEVDTEDERRAHRSIDIFADGRTHNNPDLMKKH